MPQGDELSRLRAMVQGVRDRYAKRPASVARELEPEPEPEVEQPRGYEFPRSPNPLETRSPASRTPWVIRDTQPENTASERAEIKDRMRREGWLASPDANQNYGEIGGGLRAGFEMAPYVAVRSVTPIQSWRNKIDEAMQRDVEGTFKNLSPSTDPNSWKFKGAMMAPMIGAAALTQGRAISALGGALQLGTAGAAARGYAGFKAMDRIVNAERATAVGASIQRNIVGGIASAGVTAATTGANDESFLFGKGRGANVAEDVLLSTLGGTAEAAFAGLRSGRPAKLAVNNARAAVNGDLRDLDRVGRQLRLTGETLPPPAGIVTPPPKKVDPNAFRVLTNGETPASELTPAQRFLRAREASSRGAFLSPMTEEELATKRVFLKHDDRVGFAIDKDGDLQGVFNNGGPKGAGGDAVLEAVASGAKTLDAFDGYLPQFYHQLGFRETGRMKFNRDYAPEGWNYEKYGEPDVVFMAYKGLSGSEDDARAALKGGPKSWTYEPTANYFDDYDAAKRGALDAANGVVPDGAGRPANVGAVAGEGVDDAPPAIDPRPSAEDRRPVVDHRPLSAEELRLAREERENFVPSDRMKQFAEALLDRVGGGGSKKKKSSISREIAKEAAKTGAVAGIAYNADAINDRLYGPDRDQSKEAEARRALGLGGAVALMTHRGKYGTKAVRALLDGAETVAATAGKYGAGEPRPTLLYHGTNQSFGDIDVGKFDPEGALGPGYYMTESPSVAGGSADLLARGAKLNDKWVMDGAGGYAMNSEPREMRSALASALHLDEEARSLEAAANSASPATKKGALESLKNLLAGRDAKLAEAGQFQTGAPQVRVQRAGFKTPFDMDERIHVGDDVRVSLEEADPKLRKLASLLDERGADEADDYFWTLADNVSDDGLSGSDVYDSLVNRVGRTEATKLLKAAGYDGITRMDPNSLETARTWVAFDPEQVKAGFGESAARGAGVAGGFAVATDEDASDEQRAAGAGLSALFISGKGRLGQMVKNSIKKAVTSGPSVAGNLPNIDPPRYRSPSARSYGTSTNKPFDMADFGNYEARLAEFKNDPSGKARLEAQIGKVLIQNGDGFKKRRTFDEVRANADRLGLDAAPLLEAAKKRGLSPEEQLATMDIASQNIENIVEYQNRINDPKTPQAEKDNLSRLVAGIEAQTNELIWNNLTERSEAGRNLVFQKIAAKRTMDPIFWASRAAKNLGAADRLTGAHWAEISAFAKAKDRAGMVSYVNGLKPGKWQRWVTTAYKAGLLTNPATHSANVSSNTAMAGMEIIKDAPASVADKAMTGILNAALGGPVISRSRDFNADAARVSWLGAKEGAKTVVPTLKGMDAPTSSQLSKYDQVEEVRTGNPIADAYLNGPFRALRASDNVYRESAFYRSLEQQRRLAGMRKSTDMQDAVSTSTGDMLARAVADAEIATFQNESLLGNVGSRVKQTLAKAGTGGALAGEFLLPFTKTPGAVAGSVVRYSPLGLARATAGLFETVAGTVKAKALAGEVANLTASGAHASDIAYTQRQLEAQVKLLQEIKNTNVDRFGRGSVGTALMGLGAVMAMNGLLTVKPARTDRTGRDSGEVEGDPGSTIDFGPINAQIDRLSPVANLLLIGAYAVKGFHESNPSTVVAELEAKPSRTAKEELKLRSLRQQAVEDGPRLFETTWGTALAAGLGGIGNTIIEQPVFSGVKRVEDVLADPVKATQKAAYTQAAAFIPSGVGAVARVLDPKRRETETLGETFRNKIPGMSRGVPAKLDALGTEITEPLSVRLANLLSPARISSDRTSGGTPDAEVRRVIAELDIPLSRVTQRRKEGESVAGTRERQRLVGEEIRKRIANIIPTLDQLPVDQRTDFVKTQIARARAAGNRNAKSTQRETLFSESKPDVRP